MSSRGDAAAHGLHRGAAMEWLRFATQLDTPDEDEATPRRRAPGAGPTTRSLGARPSRELPVGDPKASAAVERRVQAKRDAGRAAERELFGWGQAPLPSGGGRPLEGEVRAQMEHAFGVDLSAVRVHEGPDAAALGARAFARGTELHFAPGQYQPDTTGGRELIGHELAHVVQQAEGRAGAAPQAKGGALDDDALEREADELGARAARGERVATRPVTIGPGQVIQCKAATPEHRKDDASLALAIIGSLEAGGRLDLLNLYDSAVISLGWQQVVLTTGALGDVITRYLDAWRGNHPGQPLQPYQLAIAKVRDRKDEILGRCRAAGVGGDYTQATRAARSAAVARRVEIINALIGADVQAVFSRAAQDPEMEAAQVGHAFDGKQGGERQGAIGRGLRSAEEAGLHTTVGRAMAGHAYNGGFGHADDQLVRAGVKDLKGQLVQCRSTEEAVALIEACLQRMKTRAKFSKASKAGPFIAILRRWCVGAAPDHGNGRTNFLQALVTARDGERDLVAEQLTVATWATLMYGFAYPWAKHEFNAYLTLMATDPRLQGDGKRATIWGNNRIDLVGGDGAHRDEAPARPRVKPAKAVAKPPRRRRRKPAAKPKRRTKRRPKAKSVRRPKAKPVRKPERKPAPEATSAPTPKVRPEARPTPKRPAPGEPSRRVYSSGHQQCLVFVSPDGLSSATPDIFLFLHGHIAQYGIDDKQKDRRGLISGADVAEHAMKTARGKNLIAILPQGVVGRRGAQREHEGGFMRDLQAGLPAFLGALLPQIAADHGRDALAPGRISIAGHSAGGYMGVFDALDAGKGGAMLDHVTDITLMDANYSSAHNARVRDWLFRGKPGKSLRIIASPEHMTGKYAGNYTKYFVGANLDDQAARRGFTVAHQAAGDRRDHGTTTLQHSHVVKDGRVHADVLLLVSRRGHHQIRDDVMDDAMRSIGEGAAGSDRFGRDDAAAPPVRLAPPAHNDDGSDAPERPTRAPAAPAAAPLPPPAPAQPDAKAPAQPTAMDPTRLRGAELRNYLYGKGGLIHRGKLQQRGLSNDEYDFKQRVYDASVAQLGTDRLYGGVPAEELGSLPGGGKLRHAAIPRLNAMLTALRAAMETGAPGSTIAVGSTYRSPAHDFALWDGYFQQYLAQTKAHRERAWPDDPYGAAAVAHLVQHIRRAKAPPGGSNHSNGIAVDLIATVREHGQRVTIPNAFRNQGPWKKTFQFAWLEAHCREFGFKRYAGEAWHYDCVAAIP